MLVKMLNWASTLEGIVSCQQQISFSQILHGVLKVLVAWKEGTK
jgi:hypothetical protein